MMIESKIFYICDKMKHCSGGASCGKYCNHTSDPEHAKNGAIHTPAEAAGRCSAGSFTDGNTVYFFERS